MKYFGIRNKVRAATVFIFALLLITAGGGIYYVADIKQLSRDILKDNYESLEYCYAMQNQLIALDKVDNAAIAEFEKYLLLQENNITEAGEKEVTTALRDHFGMLKESGRKQELLDQIQSDLSKLIRLNMNAIQIKSELTDQRAKEAVTALSVIATLVFIIGFVFTVNFPSLVTGPVSKLKLAVYELSSKNYSYRVHIKSRDEFADLANTFNSLAERLEIFENSNINRLMIEKKRAEAVINSLKDASIGIAKDGNVLFANQKSLELLNLSVSDIVGKSAESVFEKNDLFRFIVKEAGSTPFKIVTESKENYYIIEKYPITLDDTEVADVIALKNITSFQEKDTAKTNFIATISHELKTPLSSTNLGLKLLSNPRTGELNEMQKEIVRDLQKGNSRLLKLVSELLDMSQVETGNINLNLTSVNLTDTVFEVVESLKQQAAEKGLKIVTVNEKGLVNVKADKEKASWVLVNLLTNAIRHSPSNGQIQIQTEAFGKGASVSVTDSGAGIPVQYRDKIFTRFFKVPGSGSEHKGTGLGLSICKEFMNAMGGIIEYIPAESGGSVFKVTFRNAWNQGS